MSSVVIAGNTSGSVTLDAPAVAGTTVLTLPTTNGTLVTTGTTTGISGSAITTGTVATNVGGTGITSFTSGGAVYATSTSALTTGTLPVASGGTGQTTALAGYNALSPMTTLGDMEYEGAGSSALRLPIGTTGQVLTVSGGIPAWATVSTSPPTGFGDIGTYVIAASNSYTNNTQYTGGQTFAGSSLFRSTSTNTNSASLSCSSGSVLIFSNEWTSFGFSGTWRMMVRVYQGDIGGVNRPSALFVRIS